MRYRTYLRGRYRALFSYIGMLMMIIGVVFFIPLLSLPFYPEEFILAGPFVAVGASMVLCGATLWRRFMPGTTFSITLQEGMVTVVVVWLAAILAGAIPFMFILDLDATQAIFESTSGWTTTGLSVVDVANAPRVILLYRSIIQLAGGAGIAIIGLSALTGPAGAGLSAAEGRSDQLAPHVRRSAAIVLRIYLSYIVIGILALRVAGMNWFDSVNHALTALATGGFSTRVESIGFYDSALIEAVVIVLMLLGGLNFLTAYTLYQGKFKAFTRNGEIRLEAVLLLVTIPLLLLVTTSALYSDADKALRSAIFEATSALTGTGFGTVNHATWNAFGWIILIVLMSIGCGSGSTAGGMKLHRVYVMFKAIKWELRSAFMPTHMVNEPAIWQGEQRGFLNDKLIRRTSLLICFYIGFLFLGAAIIAAHGYTLGESLFEYASTLGTVGLSVGITGPDAAPTMLWAQSIGMFLGRLEFFAVFIGITKLVIDARLLTRKPSPTVIEGQLRELEPSVIVNEEETSPPS
jgi:trk system potassium uptake protein TrkH